MRKQTKRYQQAEQTKLRILRYAKELFERADYKSISMAELAEASGTSIGCIYGHFTSKEDILLNVLVDKADLEYDGYYKNLVGDKTLDSADRLNKFFIFRQTYGAKEDILRITYSQALKHPEAECWQHSMNRKLFSIWHELIADCRKDGFIHESWNDDDVYFHILLLSRGIFFSWMAESCSFDVSERSGEVISIFLSGLNTIKK